MTKFSDKTEGQKGSMMVEALAMLGLITMVTPVLYKKAAERTTELQDINTAAQMRTISKALDDYIKDNYIDFTANKVDESWDVTEADIRPYLPYGFNLDDNKLFSKYQMAIKKVIEGDNPVTAHATLTGIVVAPVKSGQKLPGIRSAKVASMVGANGSVYKSCSGPDGDGLQFCGVQGGWFAKPADYGIAAPDEGSIASISLHAINASSGAGSEHVLFRDESMGDDNYNRMQTNLKMDGFSIEEVNRLVALSEGDIGTITITGADEGETAKEANLLVEGAGEIKNLLTAGSAKLGSLFEVGTDGAVTSGNKITVTANGLDVQSGETTLKNTTISGTATINDGKLTANKGAEILEGLKAGGGVTIDGGTATTADGNTYSLAVNKKSGSDGSLLVQNNARINNDLYVGGEFSADAIYGRSSIGGGELAGGGYNFTAGKDNVKVATNSFTVGDKISVDGTSAKLTAGSYVTAATTSGAYMKNTDANYFSVVGNNVNAVAAGTATVQGGGGAGKAVFDANATVQGGNASLKATTANSGVAQVEGATAQLLSGANKVLADGSNVRMQIDTRYLKLDNNKMLVFGDTVNDKEYLTADENDILFVGNGAGNRADKDLQREVMGTGVLIRREGIIDLPRGGTDDGRSDLAASSGRQDVPGYIKLDRIIGNQSYKEPWNSNSKYSELVGPYNMYDAYQVNPAYTSVMHDIKLTSRGNARLSDVLPDFINKGIYVIDNTYEEPAPGLGNWETYTVSVSGGRIDIPSAPSDCGDTADCITTPWLGFVPTPQCPPGYSRVITINPIRWKMAEAYAIAMDPAGAGSVVDKFKAYFVAPRNPTEARFELSSVTASNSSPHTHEVPSGYGMPLTFQTNTWLNTTIAGVRAGQTSATTNPDGSANLYPVRQGDFLGWHAIMGFLYHGGDYYDYIKKASNETTANKLNGKIVWNLFPVYNEELTAIANVYCYFERRDMNSAPVWGWDGNLVDKTYNQLGTFRSGFTKDGTYVGRLNDPVLGYTDPW